MVCHYGGASTLHCRRNLSCRIQHLRRSGSLKRGSHIRWESRNCSRSERSPTAEYGYDSHDAHGPNEIEISHGRVSWQAHGID